LRRAGSYDLALLRQIFTEAHCAGFDQLGLAPSALAGLIQLQFQARQAQYGSKPGAAEYLICREVGGEQVVIGSCWLSDSAEQVRVLDIAVLTEHRRRGVARAVLGGLCARAAAEAKPVRLSVWHANAPAIALYRELGFTPVRPAAASGGPDPLDLGNGYLELQFLADATTLPSAGAR
jgi:ribosomal protein S18 acetylase RimI-like enzyme